MEDEAFLKHSKLSMTGLGTLTCMSSSFSSIHKTILSQDMICWVTGQMVDHMSAEYLGVIL